MGQLGIILEIVEVVVDVGVWVYNWIDSSNQPDKWSTWDGDTKNKFVDEALVQAFAQSKIPPRDWFWDAVQTVAESRDDYPTWMADNADWVPWRIEAMEKKTGKKWDQVNPTTVSKTASIFSTDNILGIMSGVLFFGLATGIIYNASKNKKHVTGKA